MLNLKGLGLQNFRTFQEKENIEFAPITLITGANNTGKSSVFKALQFLAHNFKDGNVSESLDFKSMKHELGSFERIYNRASKFKLASSIKPQNLNKDFQNSGFSLADKNLNKSSTCDDDLVFTFPIKFGGKREIESTLEIRYTVQINANKINHYIKSVAVFKDESYLFLSNNFELIENYDEGPYWEMQSSINLKEILQIIKNTPINEDINSSFFNDIYFIDFYEKYFALDLFSRVKQYNKVYFDLPPLEGTKDCYESFIEKFEEGKSLFSDYSDLSDSEKSKLLLIEEYVLKKLNKGQTNRQEKIFECFKTDKIIGYSWDGMIKDILSLELGEHEFKNGQFYKTTPMGDLFKSLLEAIGKDFFYIVSNKIDSLNQIFYLPTTRGKNRDWFIDEQNSEDIQLIRDFSNINLNNHPKIESFVNFWIGKGEINELDEAGRQIEKGFKIGKKLSVFRDDEIGLTKVFLVNFDGSKTSLIDLGYGISQLLPIIMKIAVISHKCQVFDTYCEEEYEQQIVYFKPSTLLIEEPEANLHPSLQSKMAELFIDAASKFNIQFLIETHSEYLIYKFQEYIGNKIVSTKDIKMYYFNDSNNVLKGEGSKYINHVKIDTDGSINYEKYFGKGFFDEQTNLKLSLLNIQRNNFLEDYNTIKEELLKSNQMVKQYDNKILELNHELSSGTTEHNLLKDKIKEVEKEKGEQELKFQNLLRRQEAIIDEYTAKTDYSKYLIEIENIIDTTKIDNSKTLHYLSTGKYLLKNLDNTADFAPVIIQYGRAVEFEMIKWVSDFKSSSNIEAFVLSYKNDIKKVFTDLGLSLSEGESIYEVSINVRINIFNLLNYVSKTNTWTFGNLTQIFELLYYISPIANPTYNYYAIPLMFEFSEYLRRTWSDYDSAERLFNTYRKILDLRNCAGHTYSSNVCSSDIIDRNTAENYVNMVEDIFKYL